MKLKTLKGASTLRPAAYQLIPLTKIIANSSKCVLICDGVGVGKTISASYCIIYLTQLARSPALVVCPPVLLPKWVGELKSKFDIQALPVRSDEDFGTMLEELDHYNPSSNRTRAYVMTNSIINSIDSDRIINKLAVLVIDEIHTYRNRYAQIFEAIRSLASCSKYKVGLSATPINNSLDDLVSELNVLMPGRNWEALNAAVAELWNRQRHRLVNPLVTRFTKEKLGIHFAKRDIQTKTVSYPKNYATFVKNAIAELPLNGKDRRGFFDNVTYYRLASSSPEAFRISLGIRQSVLQSDDDPKLQALLEFLQKNSKTRWLIFCEFQETARYVAASITNRVVNILTGETPLFEREDILKEFKNSRNSVLVMTSVGSEGLDLQFCSSLINYDLHWNPMRLEQRAGRIDRVGQSKPRINIVNIVVDGSIDERVISVLIRKLNITSGSVFAIGNLLDSKGKRRRDTHATLYDPESIAVGLKESEALVSAIKNTTTLPETDYEILASIDKKYCSPSQLISSGCTRPNELLWLKPNRVTQNWIKNVQQEANFVNELIEYYT